MRGGHGIHMPCELSHRRSIGCHICAALGRWLNAGRGLDFSRAVSHIALAYRQNQKTREVEHSKLYLGRDAWKLGGRRRVLTELVVFIHRGDIRV